MTISRDAWTQGWSLLVERFCRGKDAQPSPAMAGLYLDFLSVLDDAQFIAAVKQAIATIEWPGLPPAAHIIRLVCAPESKEAKEAEAGQVFARVLELRAYTPHGMRLSQAAVVESLGPWTWDAVVAVGLPRILQLTDEAHPFVRREFVTAWLGSLERDIFAGVAGLLNGPRARVALPAHPPATMRLAGPVKMGEIVTASMKALGAGEPEAPAPAAAHITTLWRCEMCGKAGQLGHAPELPAADIHALIREAHADGGQRRGELRGIAGNGCPATGDTTGRHFRVRINASPEEVRDHVSSLPPHAGAKA